MNTWGGNYLKFYQLMRFTGFSLRVWLRHTYSSHASSEVCPYIFASFCYVMKRTFGNVSLQILLVWVKEFSL
jgi:hypothetical protein